VIVANATGKEDIEGYRGLAWRGSAVPAVCMAIFLFSLTGLPPFAGFVGKFFLFAAVIKQEFYLLAVVAVINSVISLYYYARVVKVMFLDFPEPADGPVEMNGGAAVLLGLLSGMTLLFGIYWGPLVAFTNQSLKFFVK
jgi:NADH-quinone oxidoreductase subunit N